GPRRDTTPAPPRPSVRPRPPGQFALMVGVRGRILQPSRSNFVRGILSTSRDSCIVNCQRGSNSTIAVGNLQGPVRGSDPAPALNWLEPMHDAQGRVWSSGRGPNAEDIRSRQTDLWLSQNG